MCLLIHQPKGTTFSKKEIKDFLDYNQDGFGFAYAEGGRLNVVKVVDDTRMAIDAYFACIAGKSAMIHFRMATHGDKTSVNCHPFLLTPEIAMAHNGILDIDADTEKGHSDTRIFAETILRPIALADPDALFTERMAEILGGLIGSSNRLMFIRADGKTNIVNRSGGVMHKRAWMSNTYAWSSPEKTMWNDYAYSGYGKRHDWDRNDEKIVSVAVKNGVIHTPHKVGEDAAGNPIDHAGKIITDGALPTWEEGDAIEKDDAPASDIYIETLDDVAHAWYGMGFGGVQTWLRHNPDAAILVLMEGYDLTEEQATSQVQSNPAVAAQWLADLVSDDPCFQ